MRFANFHSTPLRLTQLEEPDVFRRLQETISSSPTEDAFRSQYRQWIQKVIPFQAIALLSYDSLENRHTVYDVFPEDFQKEIQHQLEEGIIQWVGENGKIFIIEEDRPPRKSKKESKVFIPLKRNGYYGGLIEIVTIQKSQHLDLELVFSLNYLRLLVTHHFEREQMDHKLNDLNRRNQYLSRENRQLRELALLGAISTNIVHQLSNRLTTVYGRANLVLRPEITMDKIQAGLKIIEKEARRAATLIHEFLAYLPQNPSNISEPVPLVTLLKNIIRRLYSLTEEKAIKVRCQWGHEGSRKMIPSYPYSQAVARILFHLFLHLPGEQTVVLRLESRVEACIVWITWSNDFSAEERQWLQTELVEIPSLSADFSDRVTIQPDHLCLVLPIIEPSS